MNSNSQFKASLEEVAELVRDLDHKVISQDVDGLITYEDDDNNSYSFDGHKCEVDDKVYVIAGHPEFRFFGVVYFSSITRHISHGLDTDTAEAIVDESKVDDESIELSAARKLLRETPEDMMETFKSYIYMMVSGGNHSTDIREFENGAINFVTTQDKMFPYEDDFGIKECHESTQSILAAGGRVDELVSRSIRLDEPEDNLENTSLTFHFGW